MLMVALALPRSGEASRAAVGLWLPWCHTTAVASVVFFFFFSSGGSSRFLRRCQPITPPPPPTRKFQMEAKNNDTATVSTWTPFSRKTFLRQQARGKRKHSCAYSHTHTPPALTMQYRVTQPTPTLVIPARNRV